MTSETSCGVSVEQPCFVTLDSDTVDLLGWSAMLVVLLLAGIFAAQLRRP